MEYDYIECGDCLELMKDLPNCSIDMILCDLPYGTTQNKWDSVIDLKLLWTQYERVIKNNGAIVLFSQMPFTAVLASSNLKLFRYEWVWQKTMSTGFLNAKKMPLKAHENILVFYKSLPIYNPQMRLGFKSYSAARGSKNTNYSKYDPSYVSSSDGARYPVDILEFKHDKEKLHPTQKPVELLEYLIKTYTNEGDVVLDTCMGSGSTIVAAVNTNRHYIGFELDHNYFDIACKRLDEVEGGESIGDTGEVIREQDKTLP